MEKKWKLPLKGLMLRIAQVAYLLLFFWLSRANEIDDQPGDGIVYSVCFYLKVSFKDFFPVLSINL